MAVASLILWATWFSVILLVSTSDTSKSYKSGHHEVQVKMYNGVNPCPPGHSRGGGGSDGCSCVGCCNNSPVTWPPFLKCCCDLDSMCGCGSGGHSGHSGSQSYEDMEAPADHVAVDPDEEPHSRADSPEVEDDDARSTTAIPKVTVILNDADKPDDSCEGERKLQDEEEELEEVVPDDKENRSGGDSEFYYLPQFFSELKELSNSQDLDRDERHKRSPVDVPTTTKEPSSAATTKATTDKTTTDKTTTLKAITDKTTADKVTTDKDTTDKDKSEEKKEGGGIKVVVESTTPIINGGDIIPNKNHSEHGENGETDDSKSCSSSTVEPSSTSVEPKLFYGLFSSQNRAIYSRLRQFPPPPVIEAGDEPGVTEVPEVVPPEPTVPNVIAPVPPIPEDLPAPPMPVPLPAIPPDPETPEPEPLPPPLPKPMPKPPKEQPPREKPPKEKPPRPVPKPAPPRPRPPVIRPRPKPPIFVEGDEDCWCNDDCFRFDQPWCPCPNPIPPCPNPMPPCPNPMPPCPNPMPPCPNPMPPCPNPMPPCPNPMPPCPNPMPPCPDPMPPCPNPMSPCPNPCGPCGCVEVRTKEKLARNHIVSARNKRQVKPTFIASMTTNFKDKRPQRVEYKAAGDFKGPTTRHKRQAPEPQRNPDGTTTVFKNKNSEINVYLDNNASELNQAKVYVDDVLIPLPERFKRETENNNTTSNSTIPEEIQQSFETVNNTNNNNTSTLETELPEDPNLSVIPPQSKENLTASTEDRAEEKTFFSHSNHLRMLRLPPIRYRSIRKHVPDFLDRLDRKSNILQQKNLQNRFYHATERPTMEDEPRFYSNQNNRKKRETETQEISKYFYEPIIHTYLESLNMIEDYDAKSIEKLISFLRHYSKSVIETAIKTVIFSENSDIDAIVAKCIEDKVCMPMNTRELQHKLSTSIDTIATLVEDFSNKLDGLSSCVTEDAVLKLCVQQNIRKLRSTLVNIEAILRAIFERYESLVNKVECKPNGIKLISTEIQKVILYFNQQLTQYPHKKLII